MADPLSTIASILAILDATIAVYNKVHDATRLPKAFQKIAAQMSLVWDTLAEAEEKYPPDSPKDTSIEATLLACKQDTESLQKLYAVVCEHINSNWLSRYKRHISTLAHGRKEKVEELWKRILETVQTLTSYHIFRNLPTSPDNLKTAIAEIEEVEDSLPEEGIGHTSTYNAPVAMVHSGSGTNNARVAAGQMYNDNATHEDHSHVTNNYGQGTNDPHASGEDGKSTVAQSLAA